ncbi:diguanylate cyclase [Nitrincola sp.]|uniref:GGDEF domain-containing protein n=1 Tax=Nitrincola sp. TaxID=1926584 RepID=UPI003A8EBD54
MEFFSRSLVLLLLYYLMWHFASLFEIAPLVSAFYPAAGVILLFVFHYGPRYIPVAALAIMLGGFPYDQFWDWQVENFAMSVRQLLVYAVAALLARRLSAFSLPVKTLHDVSGLILVLTIATLVSAATAVGVLRYMAVLPAEMLLTPVFFSFWIGDLGGALMFMATATLFIDLYEGHDVYRGDVFDKRVAWPLMVLLLTALIVVVYFMAIGVEDVVGRVGYLILLPVAWAATVYGMRFALLTSLVVNLSAVTAYMLLDLNNYPVLDFQLLFVVTVIMSMILGASLEEREQARFDAAHDPLTRVMNRRAFFEQGSALFERARRHDRHLALLMVDLDYFKTVNDTWGHKCGDQVLMAVAECCRNACRQTDLHARLGGEEFVLLLDDADAEQSAVVAERLRGCVEKVIVPFTNHSITASIGISQLTEPTRSLEEMMSQADKALYAAKADGRNNCKIFTQLVRT